MLRQPPLLARQSPSETSEKNDLTVRCTRGQNTPAVHFTRKSCERLVLKATREVVSPHGPCGAGLCCRCFGIHPLLRKLFSNHCLS